MWWWCASERVHVRWLSGGGGDGAGASAALFTVSELVTAALESVPGHHGRERGEEGTSGRMFGTGGARGAALFSFRVARLGAMTRVALEASHRLPPRHSHHHPHRR